MKNEIEFKMLGVLACVGAFIGLGQLLASTEKLTWRIIIGRMICSGGIAICAAWALQYYPDISKTALAGLAAVFASLGTSFVEKLISSLTPWGK